jgi:hypothetical protein
LSTIADLLIKVSADTAKAARDLDNVGKKGSSSLGKVAKVAKTAALGLGTAAGVGLAWAAKTGWDEYQQGAKVGAQTNAVLKSTGGIANVSSKHVSDLAGSLLKKSGVDDEAIQSGENLLLTFTGIRNEVGKGNDIFDQATGTMLDMSVALGQDTKSSAIQLGKALNDPIKGVTALQRVGVSFTAAQKEQIKALESSGHHLEAQKLILHELHKEFDGSAEAVGKTLPGQISIARESLNNWLGELVAKAIPIVSRFISWTRDHWPEIQKAISRFWADVKPTLVEFYDLADALYEFIRKNWGTIGPIVKGIGKTIEDTLKTATSIMKVFAALLRGDWSGAWNALKEAVGHALDGMRDRIAVMGAIGGALWKAAKTVATNIASGIVGGLAGLGGKAWAVIDNIGAVIAQHVVGVGNWGKGIGSRVASGVVGGLDGIGGRAWGAVNNIGAVIAQYAGAIAGWGRNVASHLAGGIVSGLSGIGGKLVSIIKSAINALIDRINSALSFHVSIDTHIPGVGKKSFGFDSHIPHLAKGARNFGGGLAVVGEHGAELVNIPGGSTVHTAADTRRMMDGGNAPDGDLVLMVDGEVLGRIARKELTRAGRRGVNVSFGAA